MYTQSRRAFESNDVHERSTVMQWLALSSHSKKSLGPFGVESLWVSPRYSGFLPQSRDIQITSTAYSELATDVDVCVNGCPCLFFIIVVIMNIFLLLLLLLLF